MLVQRIIEDECLEKSKGKLTEDWFMAFCYFRDKLEENGMKQKNGGSVYYEN
ncbi:hypothetical protein [Anaerotignum sp.]|uniref:hypothetical protein n=1 Tax=Anaerotignum sp. TaxID=2039241 RepID=UPI003333A4CB